MPHTVVCEAPNVKSMQRVESNKGNFNLARMEASNASQRRRRETAGLKRGTTHRPSDRGLSQSEQDRQRMLVHICRQEGFADLREP